MMTHSRLFAASGRLLPVLFLFSCSVALGQRTTTRALPPSNASQPPVVAPPGVALPGMKPPQAGEAAGKMAPNEPGPSSEAQLKQQRLQQLRQLRFFFSPDAFFSKWAEVGGVKQDQAASSLFAPSGQDAPKSPKKPKSDSGEQAARMAKFRKEVDDLRTAVTLRDWPRVRQILKAWPVEEAKTAYEKIFEAMQRSPRSSSSGRSSRMAQQMSMGSGMPLGMGMGGFIPPSSSRRRMPSNQPIFTVEDWVGFLFAAPAPLNPLHAEQIGALVAKSRESGNVEEVIAQRFRSLVEQPPAGTPKWLDRAFVVDILISAGMATHAEQLLPPVDQARAKRDLRALNQWSRVLQNRHQRERSPEDLRRAWEVTQAILALGKLDEHETQVALRRAVGLATEVDPELGQAWLRESFTKNLKRGRAILAAIGAHYASSAQLFVFTPDRRKEILRLQKTAVDALLQAVPRVSEEWKGPLTVLAVNWLREAKIAYENISRGRRMLRYDAYGNPYYVETRMSGSSGVAPIVIDDLVELQPGTRWQEQLPEAVRPNVAAMRARLHMKVGDEEEAFALIRALAPAHPELARNLAGEFLKRWRENHRLEESNQIARNPFVVVYGANPRASGIPLTRSKQERNLKDLARWIAALKSLGVGPIDEEELVSAFIEAHSSAEVFTLRSIESVFGPVEKVSPSVLGKIVAHMRRGLGTIWRDPRVQVRNQTRRKKKDIEAEVERGYEVALAVTKHALAKHPDHWKLYAEQAALRLERLNYRSDIGKRESTFSEEHKKLMEEFRRAAELYGRRVASLPRKEWTVGPYQLWFFAALGSPSPQGLNPTRLCDRDQLPRIRKALESLPPAARKWHLEQFASQLYTRMSAVNPGSKFLYLDAGFEIVGNHPLAREARRMYEFYKDLVGEIRFETVLDAPAPQVGTREPFGVLVQFRHTKEIERESGGFTKYATNQNQYYAPYNAGRPPADYRDRFEKAARKILQEDFDVLSITYIPKEMRSRATSEPGWRVTPYAYILLRPKGPQVDHVPALTIDLDFADVTGYVVLPFKSNRLSIDARREPAEPVVPPELSVVQTLDERRADQGKLVLEVKAVAQGRIPPLDRLVELKTPGFEKVEVEDDGITVSEFVKEAKTPRVLCERVWTITFRADTEDGKAPKSFAFGRVLLPAKEVRYQRYVDEDLVAVEQVVPLEATYESTPFPWPWVGAGAAAGLAALLFAIWFLRRKQPAKPVEDPAGFPDEANPFTLVAWLRHLEAQRLVDTSARDELARTIRDLERRFFAESDGQEIDVEAVFRTWRRRVRAG